MRVDLRLTLVIALLGLASPSPAATSASGLPISDAVLRRQWTGAWIACPGAPERDPGVYRFRKVIELPAVPPRFVVHVSADQRFVLRANGRRVGIGPSRGDILFWRFQTFDLAPFLKPGRNLLSAIVWNFGAQAPAAQITDRTGFVVQGDGDAAAAADTNASWECAVEPGHQPWPEGLKPLKEGDPQYLVVGPGERLDAALYDWAAEAMPEPGASGGRYAAALVSAIASPRSIAEAPGYALTPDGRLLVPDELPPMEYRSVPAGRVVKAEGAPAGAFPEGGPAVVPPRTKASFLVDRRELVTAYPELWFSGGRGARVVIGYQEALLEPGKPWKKGHRDAFEGKRFAGYQDEVLPDGGPGRSFHPLWWRTWRYMKIDVETKDEPLALDRLAVHFTAYPFEERARFDAGEATLGRLWDVGWRTARACAHETYVDCPYYEQLQYVGDTRIQALISYTVAGDDRLARQAIDSFDRSRRSEGITYSRYPSAPQQFIPPFSLLWVGMVHDYWTWRDDPAFVRRQLAGTRTVLDWFTRAGCGRTASSDACPGGTSSTGATTSRRASRPRTRTAAPCRSRCSSRSPCARRPTSSRPSVSRSGRRDTGSEPTRSWRRCAAWPGTRGVGSWPTRRRRGASASRPTSSRSWPGRTRRPGQAGTRSPPRDATAVDQDRGVAHRGRGRRGSRQRTTSASTWRARSRSSARATRTCPQLEPWREMLDVGLSTFAEIPDAGTRSDCHAWSAHPNYDLLRIVAGVKPGAPGFRTVRIEPHLGTLDRLDATMPHPSGDDLRFVPPQRRGPRGQGHPAPWPRRRVRLARRDPRAADRQAELPSRVDLSSRGTACHSRTPCHPRHPTGRVPRDPPSTAPADPSSPDAMRVSSG